MLLLILISQTTKYNKHSSNFNDFEYTMMCKENHITKKYNNSIKVSGLFLHNKNTDIDTYYMHINCIIGYNTMM